IVEALLKPELSAEKFGRFKDELARELRNVEKEPPSDQVVSEIYRLLTRPYWSERERLAALEELDVVALRDFAPALLEKVNLVALSQGNVTRENALQLAGVLHEGFGDRLANQVVTRPRVKKLEQGTEYERRLAISHTDSGFELYLQGNGKEIEERAKAYLLSQLLKAPFYYQLRTVDQAGYIVSASPMSMLEVPAVMFTIQSPAFRPARLYDMVAEFLAGFGERLADMEQNDFEATRDGLVSTILQKDRKLSARTARNWREIDRREFGFDSRERLAEAVGRLTRKEMAKYYAELIDMGRGRRLVVTSAGSGGEGDAELPARERRKLVEDPVAFRNGGGGYFSEY
ncbi:MAG: insulinase family protein, partial [Pseudomonadota bacterium]|nr:insulinase family protein [Pseudomonadota bacterium]